MCGYIGVFSREQLNISDDEQLNTATEELLNREWAYRDNHLLMDADELSLPIHNRYLVVLDGTIYNVQQLREKLERKGYVFDTSSDLEVIANLFQENGTACFKELRGKFTIIIWDKNEEILYVVRDPFGIKPLYFLEQETELYFSSKKKAILQLQPHNALNKEALQHYLSFQFVPTPMTLSNDIYCLEPGHFLKKSIHHTIEKHRYFHASFQPVDGNEKQIINRIQEVMIDSVAIHTHGEPSLGAFLSGGIDSSLIVGIAKEINPAIKTFSVGFEENGFSEIPLARETAAKLGVENYSYIIQPHEFVEQLPTILSHFDDPLADPSSIPLYFAAEQAKKHVDVVISGEGADELFGGYNIYREYESLKVFQKLPERLLHWINALARIFPDGMTGKSFLERGTTPLKERYIGNAKIFEEKEKRSILKEYNEQCQYQMLTSALFQEVENDHPAQQMQYIDIHTWLPGDILLKADRMTLAHSLDVRTPFLDKEVFEVAQKIPVKYKLADNQTKLILRKAAMGFVPEDVINRKKLGFPVPISKWLRKELYDWAQGVIFESKTDHLLQKSHCLRLLIDHACGYHDHGRKLWTILMFMLWHKIYFEEVGIE